MNLLIDPQLPARRLAAFCKVLKTVPGIHTKEIVLKAWDYAKIKEPLECKHSLTQFVK